MATLKDHQMANFSSTSHQYQARNIMTVERTCKKIVALLLHKHCADGSSISIIPAEDLSAQYTVEIATLACVEGAQWLAALPQRHQLHFAHC